MKIKRLLAHIRVLGLWRGLKYWRIELACRRDPQRIAEWADRCKKEGNDCYLRGDHHGAFCMWGWANELRMTHRAFTGNDERLRTNRGGGETGVKSSQAVEYQQK